MLDATRFATSLAITLWGVAMLLLGLINMVLLWIVLGLAIIIVGLPFLAGNPWATAHLYPQRGGIDPTSRSVR